MAAARVPGLRHRYANVDVGPRPARGRHTEAEARAVNHPGRNRHCQRAELQGIARPLAGSAAFAPDFAAAAAATAGRSHRDLQRHCRADASLLPRQSNLGTQPIDGYIRLDEGMPHPLDLVAKRRKINCDFIGEGSIEIAIERRRPVDRNPRILHPPLVLHDVCEVA